MDKPGLRDALPQPRQSDTRNDPFWSSLDSSLSAAAAATPQPAEPVAKRDLDVGLGDVARGVGAGALDLVGGIGELARQASNFGKENAGKQGGDYLEQARANMANKLSPLLDVVAGAGDLAASGAESLNDGMSADAKEALGRRLVDETPEGRLTLGDGAGDIDVWAMKMAQGVGSLLPTLAAGGVTGVAAKASIGRAVTASMVKRGATQEVAEAVAAKAVSKIATGAAVTTGATGSVGSAGVNTRDTVLGMSFDELAGSDTFRQSFTRIDQDQQTAHLSDEEKLSLAREETANVASRATMSDAKVWGAAAVGSMMGDAMLFKMLAGKAATGGVLKGAAKGAAGEGISETLEEGVQQYAVNESLNEVAAADIDPMKGVMSSAIEGGLIGMGTGGAVGAVGGARGGKHASQEDGVGTGPVAEPSAPVTEDAAGPAVDPNFASAPLEDGEQAPSASQAEGELNPLGPSASQFPGVFERDQRGILRVKGDVDALASWAEQADMPYITDGDGIAIPAKYAKQAEKAIKGYRPVAAEPMAEAAPADMLAFSQVDPIEHEPAIKRQGFVMRNGDGQSTGEPEPYVRPQSGDELLYESSANWQAGQPHAESAPVDLEALRKESAQRWRDGNKPEAGTPVRTEEDTEQALNALRAEGVNGWAGRQDPKLDMPKGQEFIPHGPQAGLPAVVGDGVQQAAGKAKGLPLSDTIFAGGPSHGGQADNTNYARPHLSRDQVDRSLGEESIRDPRSPVRQSIAKAGSATDSVFGPLKSLRITRKGKPFATEKEAVMASRRGQEMPVPLNGGGFGVAAIGEVQQAKAQQGAVKQPSSNSAQQDRQDGKTEIAQNGMVIVHGSGNPGMSEQDIQIVRASGQKQGKKGRVYGGFYGTSEQDAHQAQAYADMMGGTPTLYDVKIKPGTKVLHKQGDITRLSESYINELVSQGYGVVTGTDPRGQTEHVVIDKSAVASMAPRGAQATPSQVNDTNVADIRQPSDQPAASVSAETVPAPSATAGEASQLAPAIDTGYREVIPGNQPQAEVSNEPVTPVPAISSEGQRDQPGAGEPAAAGAEPAITGFADGARAGDRGDLAAPAPVPDGQQQDDQTLTAPATDAGVAVSEVAQPDPVVPAPVAAPTPWAEAIDNPDGTITLKGDVPLIKQWAKDSGVKAIPGKGGLVVSKTSADKVREYAMPAASEPTQQVEAVRADVAQGDTTKPADSMESEPVDANALADEEAIAVADELGIEHGDNPDDARWGLDGIKADVLAAAVGRVRNPGEPVAIKRPLDNPNIVAAPPMEGDPVTRAKKVRMSQQREGGYEGLSVDEATRIVDDFLADFNGNIPLKPFIREKVSEIYRNVADDSDTARTTKGAYHPSADLFTVVAGNARGTVSGSPALRLQKGRLRESVELGAKADLLKTLRHELLGHYGLDTFAPEDKRALLQKLIAAQKEPWLAPAWRHASNLGDQLDAIKEHERELAVAEEAFARLAERELPSRAIQTWNDIKATFSRLLRKIGLVKGPIKEHELDSLIRAVSKGIRNGERTRQNIRGDKEVIGKQADEPAKDDKPERIIRFSKQAMAQGDKPAKHLTRKEAELVSHGWFKQYRGASGIKVQIHATQAELEGALELDAKDGLIRRAAFDDDAGTLHVAADTIANPKRMREILRHEVLAHYGLANVLGDGEYTKLMSRLIQSQKDPSMKPVWDWVNTHYADEDIGTKAEEVVAHLAELEQGAWGRGWDRVVAWVTRALRAVGFVPDGITAAETRSLIEGLGKKLQRSGPDDSGPDGGKKFSQEAERPANDGGIKMSQSVADNSPSLEQSLKQKAAYQAGAALGSVKNWMKQGRPVMLGALTDLQIDQVYRDITGGAVSEYQRLRTQMEADRNDILLDAETRIDPLWDALGKQEKADLSNLMHDATMARLHPDKSLDENSYYLEAKQKVERAKKPETKAAYEAELHIIERNHSELARQYNALPANAKALYDTMQDTYTKQWESLRGAIEQRLEDLLGVNQGRAMAAEMRQKMEHALQHGPYFPLTRYGDYVVKARKGDEYVREHFERRADAEQAVKQYQRDGYNAVMTVKEEGGGDSANANQLGMEMLSFLDSADGVSKSALKDEIWQAMLRMMPDASYAKHAIHRRRVKGASRDAHRAYLNSVYHYARHVSKIRYGHKMQGELDKLSEQIRAGVAGEPSSLKPEDLEIAQQVLNEMNKRHDLNMNPTGKAWAGSAGNIGFLYYIGPSVASAVVNMTQNFTVMLPQLGAKYGFAKSAAAMTQALGDYVKHGKFKAGTTEAWHSLTRSTTLPADERAILDRLYRAGALDLTQAHSIAAKADTDQQDAKPMGKRWRRAMRWAGATFHNAEVLNREVAALAAYRLLKQAEPTLNGQQYADRVAEMVYDGHGNYAASNRPRYMRNDITKVLTQFKIYSQMMTYVLYSNAIKAAKGDKVAQKTLAGVLATHWVMAGVMGLPTPITAVVYAIAAGLDDDDDRSGEASFRLALTEALGPRAGELLAKGPMDALTNLSIAGRTGLGDLWWRSPKEGTEGDDLAWHAVQQLLGPVAGIGINLARGAGQMTDGHIQRGLETMLPKSIRDVAKSYRQATEGEQTIKGDIIMDDVSTWNVAMQGLGFGSAQMAKNYDAREYIKGKEKRIADKRSQLLTDYYMARKSGEMDEVQEVLERIKMFNSINHPRERITGKSLALSFKSKLRSNERTQGGVYLNRNREYLREEGRFAD